MLEYSIIQTRGFANVTDGGRVAGFQLLVRMPNYRGAWASLVDGADVTVDGRAFPRESTRWTLGGRTFTLDDLRGLAGVHWDLAEPATLTVPLAGGLTPGVHDVNVTIYLRSPYIPAFVLPLRFDGRRELTVVPPGAVTGSASASSGPSSASSPRSSTRIPPGRRRSSATSTWRPSSTS